MFDEATILPRRLKTHSRILMSFESFGRCGILPRLKLLLCTRVTCVFFFLKVRGINLGRLEVKRSSMKLLSVNM